MVSKESSEGWNIVTSTMMAVSLTLLVLIAGLIGRAPKISLYLMLPSFVRHKNAFAFLAPPKSFAFRACS